MTIVDLSGTYMDRPGPMAPGVERPNYRMLAAIIETTQNGNHFIKFYGPQQYGRPRMPTHSRRCSTACGRNNRAAVLSRKAIRVHADIRSGWPA